MKQFCYGVIGLLLAGTANIHGMNENARQHINAMQHLSPHVCHIDGSSTLVVRKFSYKADQAAVFAVFQRLYPSKHIPKAIKPPMAEQNNDNQEPNPSLNEKPSKKQITVLIEFIYGLNFLRGFIIHKSKPTKLLATTTISETAIEYLAVDLIEPSKINQYKKYLFNYMASGDFLSAFPSSDEDVTFFKEHGFRRIEEGHLFYNSGSMIRLNTPLAVKLYNNPYFNPHRERSIIDNPASSIQEIQAAVTAIDKVLHPQRNTAYSDFILD